MKCPYCSANRDRVVDSRESRDGATIRRRRECLECARRFTSYEQIEDIAYMVVKRDGRRERFHRAKLLAGLTRACEKRPVPPRRLEELAEDVEGRLHDREDREITSQEIGSLLMDRLRELDQVAYVRFASVYRRFEDIGAFTDMLSALIDQTGTPTATAEPPDATDETDETAETEEARGATARVEEPA